jgi:hypothetical protein
LLILRTDYLIPRFPFFRNDLGGALRCGLGIFQCFGLLTFEIGNAPV